jgi:hypothetical protein
MLSLNLQIVGVLVDLQPFFSLSVVTVAISALVLGKPNDAIQFGNLTSIDQHDLHWLGILKWVRSHNNAHDT